MCVCARVRVCVCVCVCVCACVCVCVCACVPRRPGPCRTNVNKRTPGLAESAQMVRRTKH